MRKERFVLWLVWLLPSWLIYWCGVRLAAEASVKLPDQSITAITVADALHAANN